MRRSLSVLWEPEWQQQVRDHCLWGCTTQKQKAMDLTDWSAKAPGQLVHSGNWSSLSCLFLSAHSSFWSVHWHIWARDTVKPDLQKTCVLTNRAGKVSAKNVRLLYTKKPGTLPSPHFIWNISSMYHRQEYKIQNCELSRKHGRIYLCGFRLEKDAYIWYKSIVQNRNTDSQDITKASWFWILVRKN